jgi:hypothetical protein
LVAPLAITSKGYIAELPDGNLIQTSFASVKSASEPLKKTKAALATALYKTPTTATTPSQTIPAGSSLVVLGYFNEYAFVRVGDAEGWVLETNLKG